LRLSEKYDGRKTEALACDPAVWRRLAETVAPGVKQALENAAARIRAFHELERPTACASDEAGVRLELRSTPLDRVGVYVPGGTARYPSTVLMTVIPAKVAGVREVVVATPGPSPETLCAALIAGVDTVYTMGGAQAIAALAYGTESVPRVDKIVGPGNAYVTAAKRLVFGDVGIDMIAGPTEAVVAADASCHPAWVAADLLAQAEHDVRAMPVLIAVGRDVAEAVVAEVTRQLATLPRANVARQAWEQNGAVLVVPGPEEAIALLDRLAPEHAGIALADAAKWADRVTHAGAVFVGHHASEALGDYMAGPSHVLPTGRSARFASPLGVSDFMKRTSFITYDAAAVARQAEDVIQLAQAEGLEGHGRAVAMRGKP
jgi:histidinol dehydrogenase